MTCTTFAIGKLLKWDAFYLCLRIAFILICMFFGWACQDSNLEIKDVPGLLLSSICLFNMKVLFRDAVCENPEIATEHKKRMGLEMLRIFQQGHLDAQRSNLLMPGGLVELRHSMPE